MKNGLVLEGGALRGMFTAGVCDFLMENNIEFPYVIGVSAGGGNAFNYGAHQIGRSRAVINPPKQETYYGPKAFRESGRIVNLDKMFYDYVYETFPFDFDTYFNSGRFSEYVVTNCETGQPEYLSEDHDRERLLKIGKATCSLPGISNPVELDGNSYLDGSLTDSLPIARAREMGCEKLLVVLTKQEGTQPTDYARYKFLLRRVFGKKYPNLVESTLKRLEVYNQEAALLRQMVEDGVAMVIRPVGMSVGHFEGNNDKLDAFYQHGYDLASAAEQDIRNFLK